MIAARPTVEALHRYVAPLEGRRGLLRLDFNENTLGPSPAVVRAIRELTPEDYAIYPEYDGLLAQYAAHCQVQPDQVALFNGADAALRAIFDAFGEPGSRFVTTRPTFGYYQPCADLAGMQTHTVPYNEDLSFPLEGLRSALRDGARLCVLCNPNNPTGTLVPAEQLLQLARDHADTLFVVDEIYAPYTGVSVAKGACATHNVLAIHSLSKSMGLAGLRVGFACGPAQLVERAHRVTGPYDVNAFGVTAARAALSDRATTDGYIQEVRQAKQWTQEQLSELGLRHFGQGGNWLMVWPGCPSEAIAEALKARGILVRDMHGKPLLDNAFRLTIGTRPQMKRLIDALREVLPR